MCALDTLSSALELLLLTIVHLVLDSRKYYTLPCPTHFPAPGVGPLFRARQALNALPAKHMFPRGRCLLGANTEFLVCRADQKAKAEAEAQAKKLEGNGKGIPIKT